MDLTAAGGGALLPQPSLDVALAGVSERKNATSFLKKYEGLANILFILTDDQDVYMDGSAHQPKVSKLLAAEGATMLHTFATTPVCCPSRSAILTGQTIHNIPMTNNSINGNCSGPAWNDGAEKRTIGALLQNHGYVTQYAGKYLNTYGMKEAGGLKHVPPGWDRWIGLEGNSIYYNYSLSVDGVAEWHGDVYAQDYLTDLVSNKTDAFIRHWSQNIGSAGASRRPFFALASVPACHDPHMPAPQHATAFSGSSLARAKRTPNFGPKGAVGKHWFIQKAAARWESETDALTAYADFAHERRLASLLSVDDMVEKLVGTLTELNELDKSYIFYTSDHGYHLGQFGVFKDKRLPYDHDIRVPGYVRGPGILPGSVVNSVVLLIDFAPTFLEIATGGTAATEAEIMDGRSVLADLKAANTTLAPEGGRSFLIEYHGEGAELASSPDPVCELYWTTEMACFVIGKEGDRNSHNETVRPGPFEYGPMCACEDARNNTYACIRTLNATDNSLYCKFEDNAGFEELYDLEADPWQMDNLATVAPPHSLDGYRLQLEYLRSCRGSADCVAP